MTEKLYKVGWNFIDLKCGYAHYDKDGKEYNPRMRIVEGAESAYYDCPDDHCVNRIPLLAYEKILTECVNLINNGLAKEGYVWKMKCARQTYELCIYKNKQESQLSVGIKNLSIRKR
ncbi:MAG: hypothetical protein K6F27_10965 [Ruminococcus sp.]|nr:hypothetical protein [Ruminococcus sp.]